MSPASPRPRGFTLLELMTVVAILAVLTAAAIWAPRLGRERAEINNVAIELQALLHEARQTALSESEDVVVMFFPAHANPIGGVGRVVVYQDRDGNHFTAGAGSFGNYAPASPAVTGPDRLLEIWDLPRVIDFGAVNTTALPAPYATIPVAAACSFCNAVRGAIRFDARGRALFYNADGAPLAVVGGSVSLAVRAQGGVRPTTEGRTLAVTASTGAVRTYSRN